MTRRLSNQEDLELYKRVAMNMDKGPGGVEPRRDKKCRNLLNHANGRYFA